MVAGNVPIKPSKREGLNQTLAAQPNSHGGQIGHQFPDGTNRTGADFGRVVRN
jgi:hypothetical protein